MSTSQNSNPKNKLELASAPAFNTNFSDSPPYPILAEIGCGDLHRICAPATSLNINDIVSRLSKKIIRSDSEIGADGNVEFKSSIFKTRRGSFVICHELGFVIYSQCQRSALRLGRRLQGMAQKQSKNAEKIGYTLIKRSSFDIQKEFIPVIGAQPLLDTDLELLYGKEFPSWNEDFKRRFDDKESGLTILEGPPGCGKTSFIRGFMAVHVNKYRFYHISSHEICLLNEPEFLVLWTSERKRFGNQKLVLVIEDAEQALHSRNHENRTLVSTILNYTDGLISEFLKMHIICTINCKATELDAALMRPGRLIAHRIFRRLSSAEARVLAESRGMKLPCEQSDYSLAEIFNEPNEIPKRSNIIKGFAS